ncbi:helix-turn-helix domain-containing protein (plasmid) [Streptomyces sp. NEAU-sy36]|uniref:LuxR C-terminal-related transcriptional regulator n=1 Tax=unclassified Streptomyces TaxID=2593676 RepID=UPI0015D618B3|nr:MULTISPECIES: LuxR C-terminal-related transcriptional regulator [unclassified Streptomyces]QLJ06799.1 helix-turn-helix domain-containing protein [Streptomyces sp. NEAU-sy36]
MTVSAQVGPSSAHGGPDPYSARYLTPRQQQVLQLAANGLRNRDIGKRLGTSEDAVKYQMAAILKRLHVEDRAQAAAVGIRLGLVRLETVTVPPKRTPVERPAKPRAKSKLDEELDERVADLGDRVRAERQARGWSQPELGKRAGLALVTVQRLESGQSSLRTFLMACSVLGVDLAHLLSSQWQMPVPRPTLTRRQAQVLREVASGDSLSVVGARLGMAQTTVGAYLSQAYQKLGVADVAVAKRRATAVRVATEHGLLGPQGREDAR